MKKSFRGVMKFLNFDIQHFYFTVSVSILSFCLVTVGNSYAQKSNYPTPAQVATKMAKLTLLAKGGTPPTIQITGVEQDCSGAIGVCSGTSYSEANSYSGSGNSQEVVGTCLLGGETNSVWYTFQVNDINTVGFDIIPNSSGDDYDFAVYNITSIGCAGVPSATPIRCNWSAATGTTGCTPTTTSETPEISNGSMGSNTMSGWQPSTVSPPQVYVLIIDNWSGSTNGYTLNFTGAADITNPNPGPATTVATTSCTANTVDLTFDDFFDCSSPSSVLLADYTLLRYPGPTVETPWLLGVTGLNCVGGKSKTLQFTINAAMTSASYSLELIPGRVLKNLCGTFAQQPGVQNFDFLGAVAMTASTNGICTPSTAVTLTASGAPSGGTYTLTPGPQSNTTGSFTVNPIATTTYLVSVTFGGCTRTAAQTITLETVVASISPVDPQICSGTTSLTATTTIDGTACPSCNYQWSGASSQSDAAAASSTIASAGTGTYNVSVTTPSGCVSNTATSTVTVASAGATGACNVYYVSPGGGGDGLTKATPSSLSTALSNALCTASIIKMAVGVYSFSDRIDVNSFVTIEGGYNAAYTTKTSDLSGAANSTTVRRDNTADSDDGTTCTAFRIASSADDWRIQDVRIELPGSANVTAHSNGSGVTNYGVRLIGSGSTGFDVIRCFIDAGVGANP